MKIIIFGANGAIGSYLTEKYLEKKNKLLLFVRNKDAKNKLFNSINSSNLNKVTIDIINLEKINQIEKKIQKYKIFFKNSDLIINTVGELGEVKNVLDINLNKFYKTLNINFLSSLFIIQRLLKFKNLNNNKKKSIILFSGGGATSYRKNFSSYSISKLALVKIVEIMSKEINNKLLQINIISPGIIKSRMIDRILKKKKLISKNELIKINKEIHSSDRSLKKIFEVIQFLRSNKGKKISGKLISSKWDNIENWNSKKIKKLSKTDFFLMRRVQ